MKKMFRWPDLSVIFALTLSAVGGRIIYCLAHPAVILTPDSYSYYRYALDIIYYPAVETLVNVHRVPLYAVFITIIMRLTNTFSPPDSAGFMAVIQAVTVVQHLYGIFGTIILYILVRELTGNRKLALLLTTIHSFNFLIIGWERALLSEGIAITSTIIWFMLYVNVLKKISGQKVLYFTLWSIVCILTRAAFIFLPIGAILLLLVNSRYGKYRKILLVSLLTVILIPVLYVCLNLRYHKFAEYQVTSWINIFGRILKDDLPVDSPSTPFFNEKLKIWRNTTTETNPYYFINFADGNTLHSPPRLIELRNMTYNTLRNNPIAYTAHVSADIIPAITLIDPAITVKTDGKKIFQHYVKLSQSVYRFMSLIFVASSIILFYPPGNKKKLHTYLTAPRSIILLLWLQIICTVTFGYTEYGRLLSIINPMMVIGIIIGLPKYNKNIYSD